MTSPEIARLVELVAEARAAYASAASVYLQARNHCFELEDELDRLYAALEQE